MEFEPHYLLDNLFFKLVTSPQVITRFNSRYSKVQLNWVYALSFIIRKNCYYLIIMHIHWGASGRTVTYVSHLSRVARFPLARLVKPVRYVLNVALGWKHLQGCLLVNICSVVFMFILKMVVTTGISHCHLSVVICQKGTSVGCCIATEKPYTTHLSISF